MANCTWKLVADLAAVPPKSGWMSVDDVPPLTDAQIAAVLGADPHGILRVAFDDDYPAFDLSVWGSRVAECLEAPGSPDSRALEVMKLVRARLELVCRWTILDELRMWEPPTC